MKARPEAANTESMAGLGRRVLGTVQTVGVTLAAGLGRFPVIDSSLAATVRVRGLTLVTRNVKDLQRSGVDLLNPFTP